MTAWCLVTRLQQSERQLEWETAQRRHAATQLLLARCASVSTVADGTPSHSDSDDDDDNDDDAVAARLTSTALRVFAGDADRKEAPALTTGHSRLRIRSSSSSKSSSCYRTLWGRNHTLPTTLMMTPLMSTRRLYACSRRRCGTWTPRRNSSSISSHRT